MAIPTAELHVHLEGTLEPELIYQLAERNRVELPWAGIEDLRTRYDFTGLQHFLDLYYANMAVLRTEEDFADLTRAYLARAVRAGVRHTELFLDLQAHTGRGVPAEVVLRGVDDALGASEAEYGVSSGLIITLLRHLPGEAATEALREALEVDVRLLGVGLCSAETGSARPFREAFELAAAHGLHRVAHAGEEGPAANVTEVLDVLGAERVDHGIRALEDDAVVERLAAGRVPLTMCPLSNVRLQVVGSLDAYPLRELTDRGVLVTLNSDDPAYFGGYVDDVYRETAAALGLGTQELAALARNSMEASFVSEVRRAELVAEVDAWEAGLREA
ncbi:MAG: adenosine deaminase [Acidobacteria bacterium]|nr:MAG: adenosine deaminase [Acidobacteriota bacterium]